MDKINQLNQIEFSLENQSFLHSTVNIDDSNKFRPSSSKSENKHIMLGTSEQDLNSSYRDTQDSEIEDDSSTSRNTSELNVLISKSELDSENTSSL